MHLSLRHLEAFRMFCRTRSVTETARLIRVSQPAMSQTLRDVEDQVGFALFHRAGGRTQLTSEAMALLPEVERLLLQFSTLRGRAAEIRDEKAGSLSIASVPTLFTELLPSALASFKREHEKVNIRAEIFTAKEIVRQIQQDKADVGFVLLPVDEMGVAVHPLMRMRVVCAVYRGHRLAERKSITAQDMRDEQVIMQSETTPPGQVLRESVDADMSGERVIMTNQSISALNMVRHGLGIALVHPLTLSGETSGQIVCIPFDPPIYQTLGMVYSRHRAVPRMVVRFEKHIRNRLKEFTETLDNFALHTELLT